MPSLVMFVNIQRTRCKISAKRENPPQTHTTQGGPERATIVQPVSGQQVLAVDLSLSSSARGSYQARNWRVKKNLTRVHNFSAQGTGQIAPVDTIRR
jgi:hypothetical protein